MDVSNGTLSYQICSSNISSHRPCTDPRVLDSYLLCQRGRDTCKPQIKIRTETKIRVRVRVEVRARVRVRVTIRIGVRVKFMGKG